MVVWRIESGKLKFICPISKQLFSMLLFAPPCLQNSNSANANEPMDSALECGRKAAARFLREEEKRDDIN